MGSNAVLPHNGQNQHSLKSRRVASRRVASARVWRGLGNLCMRPMYRARKCEVVCRPRWADVEG